MQSRILALLLISGAMAYGAVGMARDGEPTLAPPVSDLALQQAKANNQFALDLYKGVRSGDANLFLAPYSVSSALAITYAAAGGDTAGQMAEALRFGANAGNVHAAFQELDQRLSADEARNGYTLSFANRVWGQTGLAIRASFLQLVDRYYGSGFATLNFQANPEAARLTVNQWVEQQTHDKIKNLIPQGGLDAGTRLIVTNAAYFKAEWQHPFLESHTDAGAFHLASGESVTTPMMHGMFDLRYARDADLGITAVELPYKYDTKLAAPRDVSLIALVPDQADGLAGLAQAIDGERLDAVLGQLQPNKVVLSLPKFRVESSVDASQALQDLGMRDLFDPSRADLSGLLEPSAAEKLFVSKVLHKTFINLNEFGTEAAGATAVVVVRHSGALHPKVLVMDRPFLYVIRDNATGTILFVGQLMDPRA